MPKINIRPANITQPEGGTVVFENAVLRNLLVQHPEAAKEWLATRVAPVDVSKISIDDRGRVVIADSTFADAIKKKLAAPHIAGAEAGDTACSNGAC